jgi:hypothetical protein
MAKEIVNKSVSFNVMDPDQLQMKEFVEQYPNFSGYIKRLIQRDMERRVGTVQTKKAPIPLVTNQSMVLVNGQLVPRQ